MSSLCDVMTVTRYNYPCKWFHTPLNYPISLILHIQVGCTWTLPDLCERIVHNGWLALLDVICILPP